MSALLAAVLLAAASDARPSQKVSRDPRTMGLGKSCRKNADCKHRSQRCVHQSDMKGKPLDKGFCVLPCASFESGTQKLSPGAPVDVGRKAKKPPPRCPVKYECRSAGAGVPFDMCVKQ
ncbi:MAG: hypothetical protein E6J82_08665 [Deltaproteobacteria bacterium]|nr:MAG: hypothetical protein E6J82_08665 [Deltaproteobacteria bacterium]